MNRIGKTLTVVASLVISVATAQLKTPQPSPRANLTQTVGLTDVTINYSRPGMKDREIFNNLVSFDKMWRTGANKATSIEFSKDVKIEGNEVKSGVYSMYTIPGATEWTIIINANTELWGNDGYKEEEDVARFKVEPKKLNETYETLTIDFSHLTSSGAKINLKWENTSVSFGIETNSNEEVEAQINELLIEGPSAGTYYNAVKYYIANDKDLKQALTWIDIAIEKRPEAFWYIHQKAKIQGKLDMKKEAIATATKSMEMAKESKDGDYGYIKYNEDLIKDLKAN